MGLGSTSTPGPTAPAAQPDPAAMVAFPRRNNLLPSNDPKLLVVCIRHFFFFCARLKAFLPNYSVQQHQICNRWVRKSILLYLQQYFPALWCYIHNTHMNSPAPFDAKPIWEIFQNVSSYIHSSCLPGATPMNKVIHIPTSINTYLDSKAQLCLHEICPYVLEDLSFILTNYYQ